MGGLDVGIAGFEFAQAIADLAAACSSTTGCAGFGVVVCAPIPSLIVAAATNLVVKTATLVVEVGNEVVTVADAAAYNVFKHKQIGVTYQSGAGDYAEWLQKVNPNADFQSGDIVGVKAGKISANTSDADKVMVVSSKPIVLGNMPESGTEGEYEKIAFMGQVPVKLLGTVNEGDYILPSGQNDRYGIAKNPEDVTIEEFNKIVGIAWSGLSQAGYVNVAVGLNANDVARYTIKLEGEIEELTTRIEKIESLLANGGGNSGNSKRKVTYFKPKKDQMEDALVAAELQMRDELGDEKVDNHPFFKKLKDNTPDPVTGKTYKEGFFDKVDKAFDKEVVEKTKINEKNGIETGKDW